MKIHLIVKRYSSRIHNIYLIIDLFGRMYLTVTAKLLKNKNKIDTVMLADPNEHINCSHDCGDECSRLGTCHDRVE